MHSSTLFPTVYLFVAPEAGREGGESPPPLPFWSVPFLFYKGTYSYIDCLNPRGKSSIFKTLEMRSAAFFRGSPKINGDT
jgi:hypothetical protein